jgi:hypothetical protein
MHEYLWLLNIYVFLIYKSCDVIIIYIPSKLLTNALEADKIDATLRYAVNLERSHAWVGAEYHVQG